MKYTFFWNGPFSNWYHSKFQVLGMEFTSGEQAMMWIKAKYFKDDETANQIMQTSHPSTQKQLGRQVANYNDEEWSRVRADMVENALLAKFEQNEDLKKVLLDTGDTIIVEASPVDRIWGIGFSEADALDHIDEWGENLLGKVLMNVRNYIRNQKL